MAFSPSSIARVAALPLALAFAFFGYFKTFATRVVLEQNHAWTTALPELVGRAVGVSELAAALLLVIGTIRPAWRKLAIAAAIYGIANQGCAALVHLGRGELAALPQNGVLASLALIVALALAAHRTQSDQPQEKTR
jgi:hypothetical protein